MNFCVKCDNMYYMKIDSEENGKLIYYCRNCGNEDSNISLSNLCVSTYEESDAQKNNKINEYTKFDPTLPHVYNIKCPNDNCDSNKKDKPEPTKVKIVSVLIPEGNTCLPSLFNSIGVLSVIILYFK